MAERLQVQIIFIFIITGVEVRCQTSMSEETYVTPYRPTALNLFPIKRWTAFLNELSVYFVYMRNKFHIKNKIVKQSILNFSRNFSNFLTT